MGTVFLKTDPLKEGREPETVFVVCPCIRLPIWTGVLLYKNANRMFQEIDKIQHLPPR